MNLTQPHFSFQRNVLLFLTVRFFKMGRSVFFPVLSIEKVPDGFLFLLRVTAWVVLLAVLWPNFTSAQHIILQPEIEGDSRVLENFPAEANDPQEAMTAIRDWLAEKRAKGHLTASLDQLIKIDSVWKPSFYLGARYHWAQIKMDDNSQRWLSAAGLRSEFFEGNPISREDLITLFQSLIETAGQNGHPFARVQLDSFEVKDSLVAGRLHMDAGPLIFFDGVEISGEVDVAPYYLASYLDLKPGREYDTRKIAALRNRLDELPFLNATADPIVRFRENRAVVLLELEAVNASRIDLVLGFLPADELDRRLVITGNITGEFYNQLGLGERIFLDFQRLRPQTQDLEAAFTYPYFLDLPFGLDMRFELSRRDSLFLDVGFYGGVDYMLSGSSNLRFFLDNKRSSLLSIDRQAILAAGALPDRLDYSRTGVGLAFGISRFDFRPNPTTGWSLNTDLSIGQRNIRKNDQILNLSDENTDFDALYDSLSLQSTVLNFGLSLNRFFRIGPIMTLKTALNSGFYYSGEDILFNELYRIGGNKLMRGFDEESVFASAFAISTLEYRLLTGRRSHIFAFFDMGYIENNSQNAQVRSDWLTGFGGGMTFDTAAGIFSISVALGSRRDVPVNFRRAKIHFGYLSLF